MHRVQSGDAVFVIRDGLQCWLNVIALESDKKVICTSQEDADFIVVYIEDIVDVFTENSVVKKLSDLNL